MDNNLLGIPRYIHTELMAVNLLFIFILGDRVFKSGNIKFYPGISLSCYF